MLKNKKLEKEIMLHIVRYAVDCIKSDQFLLPKTISIELEDDEILEAPCWAAQAKVGNHEAKLFLADISDTPEHDYVLLVKIDNLTTYVISLEMENQIGNIYCSIENAKWINISPLLQAKFLVGIEYLRDNILEWFKMSDFMPQYQEIVGFLNVQEQETNN